MCAPAISPSGLAIQLEGAQPLRSGGWRPCLGRLDLLAKRDFAALRKLCGVGDEDLVDMVAEIKQLNPKPGLAFGSAPVQPIVPDVFVRAAPDGSFNIELNSDSAAENPLLNQTYHARVFEDGESIDGQGLSGREASVGDVAHPRARSTRTHDPESVSGNREAAGCVLRTWRPALASTQSGRAVADAISMHESTVSRVTANKYMATARAFSN